jgi:branched-chain amino acid aminotransferase
MADRWPNLSAEELFRAMRAGRRGFHDNYLAMFSTAWGGFSLDPELWGVPADDHMVHRGDAVFEAFKVVGGRVYCLDEHLERLGRSAASMGIEPPPVLADIWELLAQAHRLGGLADHHCRLTVSRGPGGFAVNPYECQGSQLYLVTIRLKRPAPQAYEGGVRLATAPFPAKTAFSGIKTCDYLHNVLAKKSAIDAGADYVVSFDPSGFLTEGATENVAVVTASGELVAPPFERILKGVTLGRVMDLAGSLVADGTLKAVVNRDIHREDLPREAAEILLTSTSFDVLGATSLDGRPVGDGRVGPVTRALSRLIEQEIRSEGPRSVRLA